MGKGFWFLRKWGWGGRAGAGLGWRTAWERQRTWRKEVEGKRCQNLGILWKGRAKAWDVCTWRGVSAMAGNVPLGLRVAVPMKSFQVQLLPWPLCHPWLTTERVLHTCWEIHLLQLETLSHLIFKSVSWWYRSLWCWHQRRKSGLSSLFRRICFPLCLGSVFDVLSPFLPSS